jgi:hypothetical protein
MSSQFMSKNYYNFRTTDTPLRVLQYEFCRAMMLA